MWSKILLLLLYLGPSCILVSCFNIREHLTTKSPYVSHQDPSSYTPPPHNCDFFHINLVARHGARYPTSGDVKKLIKFKQTLDQSETFIPKQGKYGWIIDWTNPYTLVMGGELSLSGEEELYLMAKRMRKNFESLFEVPYFSPLYPIQTTVSARASSSGNAFAFGLFEGNGTLGSSHFQPFYLYSETSALDNTLKFYDNCQKYVSGLLSDAPYNTDFLAYEAVILPPMAQRLSQELGVYPNWNISVVDVQSMYKACIFEVAIANVTDKWCSLFTEEELLQFEYLDDIDTYYKQGYGVELSYKMSFLLLKEIITIMDSKINGSLPFERAKLRFAHAETILPLVALLGLFRDKEPIKWDSPPSVTNNRLWRSSYIAPFTANVNVVLYQCKYSAKNISYVVKLMHNEKEYEIPNCGQLYCPYEKFKALYATVTNQDFNSLCEILPSQTPTTAPTRSIPTMSGGWQLQSVVLFSLVSFLFGVASVAVIFVVFNWCKKRNTNLYHLQVDEGDKDLLLANVTD